MKLRLTSSTLSLTALIGFTATSFAGDPPAKTKAAKTTAKQCALAAKAKTEEVIPGADVQPASYFYTGKPYDADLGGYVFNYRTYSPDISRWTTSDPSGFPDGANGFAYINNAAAYAFDVDGLEKQLIAYQIDSHDANCFAWTKGDGGDWNTWYTGNGSVFFQHLGSLSPKPTVQSLAMKFTLSMLGLTASGANASSRKAYGGDIEWKIYKDVQANKTIWYFNYVATKMVVFDRTTAGMTNKHNFTPIKASGELTATTE